jgi:hypothetical protein
MADQNGESQEVKRLVNGDGKKKAQTGKPRKFATTTQMRTRFGSWGLSGLSSAGGGSISNIAEGVGGNFYSPELSTDFLELPQSLHEAWNYYRFFYRTEPFVGQAIDLHTELPLSKIRISIPKARNRELAEKATRFCEKWAKRVKLLQRLIAIVHDYHLIGEVFTWTEDTNPEMPEDVRVEIVRRLEDDELIEERVEREDADERAVEWLSRNYKGWTSVRVLPPEQILVESFNFTDEKIFELIPDSKTKDVVNRAKQGDKQARRVVESMPPEVVAAVVEGQNIPLNTDPEAGSFVHYMANKKSDYETRGHSILERCIRTLVFRDKLRQANTSIASRHMTPIRVVWGEDMDVADVDDLREQVDTALQDPDYSIIANFQINWDEMGSDQRLLDLSGEYDLTDRQLYAGLGVTESLLSGESSYSGDRINLEVINTRYMLLREQLQDFVQDEWFSPMCARMGFIEEDEDKDEVILVPNLSFTRLALRDNQDTFDALFNLYQKGSLDVDVILELLNIDPVSTREKLERDMFTVNDATFNEALRGIYSDVGRKIAENSNAAERISEYLGLEYEEPAEEGGRFG